jgi:WD40 repeat protein
MYEQEYMTLKEFYETTKDVTKKREHLTCQYSILNFILISFLSIYGIYFNLNIKFLIVSSILLLFSLFYASYFLNQIRYFKSLNAAKFETLDFFYDLRGGTHNYFKKEWKIFLKNNKKDFSKNLEFVPAFVSFVDILLIISYWILYFIQ